MPCFNAENYLDSAIESIISQSFSNFELLIIDDGSCDSSTNIIHSFNDDRIFYFRLEENMGSNFAKNFGIRKAKGRYIALADGDDISLPERLKTQYDFMENSDAFCIGSQYLSIDKEGDLIDKVIRPLDFEMVKIFLLADNYIHQHTWFFRNPFLYKHHCLFKNFFQYSDGYNFIVSISQFFKVQNLPDFLVKYRVHKEQLSIHESRKRTISGDNIRRRQLENFKFKFTKQELSLHLTLLRRGYLDDVEISQIENWINKILEANEVRKIYDSDLLYTFFADLGLRAIENNKLGIWSIEKTLLNYLNELSLKPLAILEFGSGMGTEALLKNHNVTSIEHNIEFCTQRSERHHCLLAPIENGWYKVEQVESVLIKKKYDFVLVDGPPGDLRSGILNHISLFRSLDSVYIFDDINRKEDFEIMESFCSSLSLTYKIIEGDKKKFAVCSKENF
ncbi:glycosyltransferase involved in cell wall biosynthesis [Algoriphagus yeomjeoni]|uniref:Glycosyltransferase involved in cell wall biosynthesis n=2 Tax=Algoriphagus yeomjeoni TaxID=291403 RepID=A0A327P3F2_9BACT|nr:glycosyltransferase involved in cell wall biosynthesis [Algoriphagus yeomjeoni]